MSAQGKLVLWAQSIDEVVDFTKLLVDRAAEFDAIAIPTVSRSLTYASPTASANNATRRGCSAS